MAVLKRQHAAPVLGGAVMLDLADLKAEGERLLAEAKAESDRTLREARADAARIRARALEEGREEGLAAGRTEGFAEGRQAGELEARAEVRASYAERLDALTHSWSEALGQWEASRDALMREARRSTLRLALGVAARIVRRSVAADPDLAAAQLEAALELLGKATAVTVVCAEADHELLDTALPILLERLGHTTEVTFVIDPSLGAGDILVRMAEGGVDASLATQLDRIAEALLPGASDRGAIP